jgi:hypothetical protein
LSGLVGCIVTGYDTAVGAHTMVATATDKADNTATSSRSYTVDAWSLTGFFQPVDMNGIYNTVKNGSTVPLKFRVFAGSIERTDVSAVAYVKTQEIICNSTVPLDAIEELATTGGTALRYDGTSSQFIDNWKTPSGSSQIGKCYQVTMGTQDGSSLVAYFKLK